MTIYAALGHRISVLEKQNRALEVQQELVREALQEMVVTLEGVSQECPGVQHRYADIIEHARQVLTKGHAGTNNEKFYPNCSQ